MQHTSRITNATPVHRHSQNLWFHFYASSFVDVRGEKRLLSTGRVSTTKSLLSIRGLPMFHHISTVTGWTISGCENHAWRS